ncbi:hypothetical protein B5M06_09165 [Comamonas kerstersii]|uniref:Acyl-CoA dehydrogenase C-terminal domain-containing protein n=2 Tax=Comamonas kerstersii TaxID=225992 RepID=A0A1V0BEN0_9BURK|nr:hypothetical protein B5M06_09165 [Comamonas kerstersii]
MKAVCQLLLLGHMRSADGLQVQIGTTIGCAPHLGVQARVLRSKLHQLIPVGAGPVCGLLQGLQDFRQQRPLLLGKVAVGHVVGRGGQARLGDGVHQRPCAIALLGNRKVRIPDHPGIDIAASLMADHAANLLQKAWLKGEALTAEDRAEVAIAVFEAKVIAHRTSLFTTQEIFDVVGARGTHADLGFDRFWRNARTHTLHDPLDYKLQVLGQWAVYGQVPSGANYN